MQFRKFALGFGVGLAAGVEFVHGKLPLGLGFGHFPKGLVEHVGKGVEAGIEEFGGFVAGSRDFRRCGGFFGPEDGGHRYGETEEQCFCEWVHHGCDKGGEFLLWIGLNRCPGKQKFG